MIMMELMMMMIIIVTKLKVVLNLKLSMKKYF